MKSPSSSPAGPGRELWLESVKGAALVWIFANHVAERWFGGQSFANPREGWPSVAAQLAEWRPLVRESVVEMLLVNGVRWFGWLGDAGVGMFLIAAGYGLARSRLARPERQLTLWPEYQSRLARIYPLWWLAHAILLVPLALAGIRGSMLDWQLWASFAGIRIGAEQMYYGVPAWWFVGLILQLYLVFPWIWRLSERLGIVRTAATLAVVALAIRGVGLFYFHDYLDAWSRGAIFITRLPEFLCGLALAALPQGHRLLRGGLGIVLFGVGISCGFTLAGMMVAPLFMSGGAFLLAQAVFDQPAVARWTLPLAWIGEHSYSLFLTHHFWILALLKQQEPSTAQAVLRLTAALVLSVASALFLEWLGQVAAWVVKSSPSPGVSTHGSGRRS